MNALHERFADQGLVIVGVSDESDTLIQRSIDKAGFEFPVARVSGASTDMAYQVSGFPTSVLIAPDGTVVTSERGANHQRLISKLLATVERIPELTDRAHGPINRQLQKRSFGKAYLAITKALEKAPGHAELRSTGKAIQDLAAARMARAESHLDQGRYSAAFTAYQELEELFDGVPEASGAAAKNKALLTLKIAKQDIEAGKLLAKANAILAKSDRAASRRKANDLYDKIVERYPDTATADVARGLLGDR